jgi:hypothetical protein
MPKEVAGWMVQAANGGVIDAQRSPFVGFDKTSEKWITMEEAQELREQEAEFEESNMNVKGVTRKAW